MSIPNIYIETKNTVVSVGHGLIKAESVTFVLTADLKSVYALLPETSRK